LLRRSLCCTPVYLYILLLLSKAFTFNFQHVNAHVQLTNLNFCESHQINHKQEEETTDDDYM
jgi:hypothetical protein